MDSITISTAIVIAGLLIAIALLIAERWDIM
jgi:hypothetical protein